MSIIYLPNFNPNLIEIGPLAIRYYSLAYILSILLGLFVLKKANEKDKLMSAEAYDNWLMWAVLSIILGGRLGYVLFYNFGYFLENPLEIFAVWQGGMSFHGGLLGAILGMWLFAKKYKIDFLRMTDIFAVIAPIGLFLGRVANFINLELYGRPTNSDFGFVFPTDPLQLARHPSQLYEAALEGILLFVILFSLAKFTKIKEKPGFLSAFLLIFYGIFRIIAENFREPDFQIGDFEFLTFNITMGQILSLPLILGGILVIVFVKKNHQNIKQ